MTDTAILENTARLRAIEVLHNCAQTVKDNIPSGLGFDSTETLQSGAPFSGKLTFTFEDKTEIEIVCDETGFSVRRSDFKAPYRNALLRRPWYEGDEPL